MDDNLNMHVWKNEFQQNCFQYFISLHYCLKVMCIIYNKTLPLSKKKKKKKTRMYKSMYKVYKVTTQ